MTGAGDDKERRARRRLRGFALHLVAYFAAMAVLVAVNLSLSAAGPWFVAPLVGWGGVLAVHAAYAMGLLDMFRRGGGD